MHLPAKPRGSGTTSTTSTTTTTTTPAPTATTTAWPITNHVPTWAYDDGCNGGTGASASLVQQWVSFAESNCGPSATKAVGDCHATGGATTCQAIAYLDPNKIYSDSVPIAENAQEGWWLHLPGYSDAAHRIRTSDFGGGYILNQTNAGVRSWFKNYVATNLNSFDGLMMDDQSAGLAAELYDTGATTSNEISNDSALEAAHEQMSAAVAHADGSPMLQIDNGVNVNPYLPAPFSMLNDPSSVTGLIAEGAPMSNGQMTNFYPALLDDMAYIDHTANDFLVLLSYDPSGSLQARRVQAATTLLGYDGSHIVSWSNLEQNSNDLAVWPEQALVPDDPVQSMGDPGGSGCFSGNGSDCSTGGHNDLQVASGIYRREFRDCYDNGQPIGPCAAIVNATGSSATVQPTWLTGSYSHRVTIEGGDVQSGGAINQAGAGFSAGSSTIGPHDGLLLTS